MASKDTVSELIENTIAGAIADQRLQALLDGKLARSQLLSFFRPFIVTHLNSVQVLSFLNAVAPADAAALVRENLLEEMGLDEAERPHPELLLDVARGLGASEQDIDRLRTESREYQRRFASSSFVYSSLREMGLSILLETLTFESFLSRVSDSVAYALSRHYGLSEETIRWFTLHGEVDVRHAEEGRKVVERYISFYMLNQREVEMIASRTFAENVVLSRYFPEKARRVRRAGIAAVDVYPLRIPFQESFGHAAADRSTSDSVVVRVTGKDGSRGYGEGVPRVYVTGEEVGGMVRDLAERLGPHVRSLRFRPGINVLDDIVSLGRLWRSDSGESNATYCALELAILDWAFGRAGLSFTELLPPRRDEVVYSGIIEASNPSAAATLARRYVSAGFKSLKIKVGLGDDVGRVAAVRDAVGTDTGIRVDANGAWTASEAIDALERLRPFVVDAVEQPVPATDLVGMRLVRERSGVAVVADESLVTLADAHRLVAARSCDVFNIRVSKCGGILGSIEIAEVAIEAGLAVQVGAQVGETSLLSAAGRHLAAWLPEVLYVEGSFGTYLLSEDITAAPVTFGPGGRSGLMGGIGLGVQVDQSSIDRLMSA